MTTMRRVKFVRFHAPFHETEVAGFLPHIAAGLVARKVAVYDPPEDGSWTIDFRSMDRAALIAYAREHLGMTEDPPAAISDDELRAALEVHAGGEGTMPAPASASLDRLDAMDRLHLEVFAKTKIGMASVDADLTDAELRAQIRAMAEVSLSHTSKKAGRLR